RLLTIAFVILNQYTALGLLVAAKSILRFSSDKSDESVRKESEYVLVGTMLSLVVGIVNGLIFVFAFRALSLSDIYFLFSAILPAHLGHLKVRNLYPLEFHHLLFHHLHTHRIRMRMPYFP